MSAGSMIAESRDTVVPQQAETDQDSERISLWLAVGILAALTAIFLIGGLIFKRLYFSTPVPRSAIERELGLYRSQLEKNPRDALARVSLAGAYYRLNQTDAAISELKKAQKIEPKLWDAPFQLGLIYLDRNKVDIATKYFEKAKKASPQNELSYYQLGMIYLDAKKNDLSIKNLEEAVKLKPIVADAHYSLGLAYERTDKMDKAALHFREALKYVPDMASAKKALAEISKDK